MSDRLVLMLIAYSPLILAIIWGIHFAIQANQRDKERDAIALIKFNNTKWIKAIILQHSLADWVRQKTLKKLPHLVDIQERLEHIGPLLFSTQHIEISFGRVLAGMRSMVNWCMSVKAFPLVMTVSITLLGCAIFGEFLPPATYPLLRILMGTALSVAILTIVICIIFSKILKTVRWIYNTYIKKYTYQALLLLEHCQELYHVKERLKELMAQDEKDIAVFQDISNTLPQTQSILKQIGTTWKLYIQASNPPSLIHLFYKTDTLSQDTEIQKLIFRWVADVTTEIEWLIGLYLSHVNESLVKTQAHITQVQTLDAEGTSQNVLELQKQRIAVLEESIGRVTLKNSL